MGIEEALEKQISKKPANLRFNEELEIEIGYCPVCGLGTHSEYQYCSKCGQKLGWKKKAAERRIATAIQMVPIPVKVGYEMAPHCPICGSSEYMHNPDGQDNNCCGQCGCRLDWKNPDNEDEE